MPLSCFQFNHFFDFQLLLILYLILYHKTAHLKPIRPFNLHIKIVYIAYVYVHSAGSYCSAVQQCNGCTKGNQGSKPHPG